MSALLQCSQLAVGYAEVRKGANRLPSPFDFELVPGELVALLGPNGSGKSTFLKTLSGALAPVSGMVTLMGKSQWDARERARQIALVRMGGRAPDRMTVREFVSLGRVPYSGIFDGRSQEDEAAVDEALALLNLESFADRWVEELSDGERSRVYLAEALAQQVKVLLLDEPNAFLDIPHSHRLFMTLRKLVRERGMGIVVSTHSVEYAEKYCDRMIVFADGSARMATVQEARGAGLLDWTVVED